MAKRDSTRGLAVPAQGASVDECIGFRLRQARELRHLSQSDLGRALGVSFQQIQKYERGANAMGPEKVVAAANRLGVPVEFFFHDVELGQWPAEFLEATEITTAELKLAAMLCQIPPEARAHIAAIILNLTQVPEEEEPLPGGVWASDVTGGKS